MRDEWKKLFDKEEWKRINGIIAGRPVRYNDPIHVDRTKCHFCDEAVYAKGLCQNHCYQYRYWVKSGRKFKYKKSSGVGEERLKEYEERMVKNGKSNNGN